MYWVLAMPCHCCVYFCSNATRDSLRQREITAVAVVQWSIEARVWRIHPWTKSNTCEPSCQTPLETVLEDQVPRHPVWLFQKYGWQCYRCGRRRRRRNKRKKYCQRPCRKHFRWPMRIDLVVVLLVLQCMPGMPIRSIRLRRAGRAWTDTFHGRPGCKSRNRAHYRQAHKWNICRCVRPGTTWPVPASVSDVFVEGRVLFFGYWVRVLVLLRHRSPTRCCHHCRCCHSCQHVVCCVRVLACCRRRLRCRCSGYSGCIFGSHYL